MPRLLFEKRGNAVWISHLDLMRAFQRAFKRAGLSLKHTQGFNPRPSVSIALPLSVGVESNCELLDFDLEENVPCAEIMNRINPVLISGVKVLDVFEDGRKLRDLSLLQCRVSLTYDEGVPEGAVEQIRALFSRDTLVVTRKTKNGPQDQDIIPMIRTIDFAVAGDEVLVIDAVICCQNPTLNPTQLIAAICTHLPALQPDFSSCQRIEVFDLNNNVFR